MSADKTRKKNSLIVRWAVAIYCLATNLFITSVFFHLRPSACIGG